MAYYTECRIRRRKKKTRPFCDTTNTITTDLYVCTKLARGGFHSLSSRGWSRPCHNSSSTPLESSHRCWWQNSWTPGPRPPPCTLPRSRSAPIRLSTSWRRGSPQRMGGLPSAPPQPTTGGTGSFVGRIIYAPFSFGLLHKQKILKLTVDNLENARYLGRYTYMLCLCI